MPGISNARKRKGELCLIRLFRFSADLISGEICERRDLVYPRGCFRPGSVPFRHRSGVHSYVSYSSVDFEVPATEPLSRLSWADTSASTFGRLWGRKTRALPRSFLGLPFAPRKSVAGFIAASLTGALTAVMFWGWFAPLVNRPEVSWSWVDGFSTSSAAGAGALDGVKQGRGSLDFGGWMGLGIIGAVAGLVSGVAEALGDWLVHLLSTLPDLLLKDLGSVDDNLSLPVISGTCLYGLFKLFDYMLS